MPLATGGIASMTGEQLAEVFDTNVISAQRVTSALLPLLRKGGEKKIVNMCVPPTQNLSTKPTQKQPAANTAPNSPAPQQ